MAYGSPLKAAALIGALVVNGLAYQAQAAEKVRITNLSDVSFGQITALTDVSIAQDVCVHSSSANGAYSVVASGNGPSGAFELSSGTDSLAYDVQWGESPGLSSGSSLQAGTASQEFYSSATHQFCNNGLPNSATLIIRLGASETADARAGNYSGVLSITIVPG